MPCCLFHLKERRCDAYFVTFPLCLTSIPAERTPDVVLVQGYSVRPLNVFVGRLRVDPNVFAAKSEIKFFEIIAHLFESIAQPHNVHRGWGWQFSCGNKVFALIN